LTNDRAAPRWLYMTIDTLPSEQKQLEMTLSETLRLEVDICVDEISFQLGRRSSTSSDEVFPGAVS
jgi:hypothetical protein